MAILTKGQTFADGDAVTSSKLNNLVDNAAFVTGSSGTTDDSSLEVNGGGRLQIKDSGVTSAKLAAGAVTTSKLPNATSATDGVTYAKIQQVASMRVIGNASGVLAAPAEVAVLDENDMVSDSATSLATQQSIKAYTDSSVAASFVLSASQTASGTFVDFTGIPSTAKRITLLVSGLSTGGTNAILVRLGDSGGFENTGYLGATAEIRATPDVNNETSGILLSPAPSASDIWHGTVTISKLTGNFWVATVTGGLSNTNNAFAGGATKELSSTLTSVRIIANGDSFDAGTVAITYE